MSGGGRSPAGTPPDAAAPGHTCDLHRQDELVNHYTLEHRLLTILWDKDLQLPGDSPLRQMPSVVVCEAALAPRPRAVRLLFPVADADIDGADPVRLAVMPGPLPLVYIGNQYDHDEAFSAFFAPVAARFEHRVAGKWTRTAD